MVLTIRKRLPQYATGQALLEFVFVLPVIILIFLAVFYVGMALYTGANASSSLSASLQNQASYADAANPTAVATGLVNGYSIGSYKIMGSPVDSVSITTTGNTVDVVKATKSVTVPLFPTFNFTVAQGIKSNLLKTNTSPTSTGMNGVPFAVAQAQVAAQAASQPDSFSFESDVAAYIPIDRDSCTPDLSVFDDAEMESGCDGACRAESTADLFDVHMNAVNAAGGCSGTWVTDFSNVVFSTD